MIARKGLTVEQLRQNAIELDAEDAYNALPDEDKRTLDQKKLLSSIKEGHILEMVQAKRKVIEFEPDDAITANKDKIIKIQ